MRSGIVLAVIHYHPLIAFTRRRLRRRLRCRSATPALAPLIKSFLPIFTPLKVYSKMRVTISVVSRLRLLVARMRCNSMLILA